MTLHFPFDNSYVSLGGAFATPVLPAPVPAPRLIKLNESLARALGLDPGALASPGGVAILAGNRIAPGSDPVASAYAGHQFGNFVPQLGDGRAILLGEVLDQTGHRRDIQLKGSGPTPFSRRGDGRAALGPVLREYIVSEAMAALGIPTTRALAAVATGDVVYRETELPGAILTRVASSHIRVGTFQYFAARQDVVSLKTLAAHVAARHYPEIAEAPNLAKALLAAIITRQARLVARWMHVGFIHGVMNTDNMSVAGETIDYGPCAFMDAYDAATVFSSIDYMGRYAYQNQPGIAHWNLVRLAEALLPLLAQDRTEAIDLANDVLGQFPAIYEDAYAAGLRRKLGLALHLDGDDALGQDLLGLMAAEKADFTMTFRKLGDAIDSDAAMRGVFQDSAAFEAWAATWRARIAREPAGPATARAIIRAANPAFIPRNHRVEAVIAAAMERQDFEPFETMVNVLARPYEDQPAHAAYALPPDEIQTGYQTFCGT